MTESHGAASAPASPKIAAMLPLAILESVRQHDRPRETLEDENLSESLPRRLGLTDVVESQIYRYERARQRGDGVPEDEVHDLFQLVLRRPDAEAILLEAGRLVARRHYDAASAVTAATRKMLPRRMASAAARRAASRLLRRVAGTGDRNVAGPPLTVRIDDAVTASADASGKACALVTGLLEELANLYTGDRISVRHRACSARGDAACEWVAEE